MSFNHIERNEMYDTDIARDCYATIDLLEKDGGVAGAEGWTNHNGNGWCLEGALGQVLGLPFTREMRSYPNAIDHHIHLLRAHPTTRAIISYLREHYDHTASLNSWNDNMGYHRVIRLLKEVAAAHTEQAEVPVTETEEGADKPVRRFNVGGLVKAMGDFTLAMSGASWSMQKLNEQAKEKEKVS